MLEEQEPSTLARRPPPGFEAVCRAQQQPSVNQQPPHPQAPHQSVGQQQHRQHAQQQQQACIGLSISGHCWRRPEPPLLPASASDWQWLPVGPNVNLLWDATMTEDNNRIKVVQDLINRALSAPLLPAQQAAVLARLDADPKLVHAIELQPQHLPALVEHTPMLAYHVLLRLLGSRCVHGFFQVLANMQLSLHSMEVVNRLTSSAQLPTEFVHLYISNCINSCEAIQDKFLQNRLVRLVCVFLQSLIRNKILNITELLHEVQAFCVKFSRIREAATLFRVLKQMELAGSCSDSPAAVQMAATADDDGAAGGHGDWL